MSDFDDLAEIAAQNSIRQNSRVTKRRGWGIGPNIEHGSPKREKPQPLSTPKPKTEVKPIEVTPAIIESLDRFVVLPDPVEKFERYELYRVISDWEALHDGFRDRVEDLEITRAETDAAGKLQPGYSAKLLCDPPMKGFGKDSLPRMLKATGMALVLVIDDDRFAPVKARLVKRKRPLRRIVQRPRPTWLFTREKAREISKNRWKDIPADVRRKMMKKAQRAAAKSRRRKGMRERLKERAVKREVPGG